MRKMLFVILIITAISFFYFAQPLSARAEETKTFVGTIKSFAYGFGFRSGPPLWPLGMIEVVADNGQKNNFLFVGSGRPRATIFYDIDGKNLGMVTEGLLRTEAAKKVGIGKKAEVTYTIPQETARFIHRNLAISVRYVPTDYVSSTTVAGQPSVATQYAVAENVSGEKTFVGKIESSSSTFHIPSKRKIVVVADNGDKLTVFVSRDIAIRDMKAYPTRIGKRAEVKYLPAENGENEAVSFRYVPSDYSPKPPAPTASTQIPTATTAERGDIFIGKVEKVTPTFHHTDLSQPRSKILAIADNGEQLLFFVPGTCPVIDATGKNMSNSSYHGSLLLKKGQRIEVKYSTITNGNSITNGQPGAESVRCLD